MKEVLKENNEKFDIRSKNVSDVQISPKVLSFPHLHLKILQKKEKVDQILEFSYIGKIDYAKLGVVFEKLGFKEVEL